MSERPGPTPEELSDPDEIIGRTPDGRPIYRPEDPLENIGQRPLSGSYPEQAEAGNAGPAGKSAAAAGKRPRPGSHDPEINADNYDYYQPFEALSDEQVDTNGEGLKKLREDNPDLFPPAKE